jgi:signal transduction histidine kinase
MSESVGAKDGCLRGLATLCCLLALSWLFQAHAAPGASPKQVLLLHSFGREFAPFNTFTEGFRTEVGQQMQDPVEFHDAAFESARYEAGTSEGPLVDYLNTLFSSRPLDLVVTVGGPAAKFALKRRSQLFPATPILFTALDQRHIRGLPLGTHDAVVGIANNAVGILENILVVLPQTTNVAVVVGSSPIEKFWAAEIQRELSPLTNRVTLSWLTNLTFARLQERAAALPPRSAIYYAFFTVDAAGVPYVEGRALPALRAAANAPIFGVFETQLGRGIVGGPLISVEELSRTAAEAAVQILRGQPASSMNFAPQVPRSPVFDWRELKRWGISKAQLPPGSEIRFRQRGLWEEHRWHIVGVTVLCLAQTTLIFLLLINRARRRQAEAATRESARRLVNAQEDERTRLARELHDDITQRLALLAIDAEHAESPASVPAGNTANRKLKEDLARLSEDVHALSHRLHPSVLEDLGLGEGLRMECERLAGSKSLIVNVNIAEGCARPPAEIALCLFRVAQEALRNIVRHADARVVRISLRKLEGGLQLIIADDGTGFDASARRDRPSLGLASMNERARQLGGTLEIDTAPGRGTTVLAWVPERALASS